MADTVTLAKAVDKQVTKDMREKAQGFYEQLTNRIYEQGMLFLEIGRLLKEIRDEEYYKYLGDGGYDSFQVFLANAEIGLKPSTAYAYIRIYEVYVLKLGYTQDKLADVPWYKLHMLATRVKPEDKEHAEEWLEKARTLGTGDFIEEIEDERANKGKETKVTFPHFYRCKQCGKYRTDELEKLCTC